MVVNENVSHFAARSLETCLAGSGNQSPGTIRRGDPTKVPLHLIDLQSADFSDRDPRLLKVVHRTQIANLDTVEWATLSYARGQMAPRRRPVEVVESYINFGALLDGIPDDMGTRSLVPQDAMQDAVRIVGLGRRILPLLGHRR
ncbi:hypothetical protein PG985_000464 [Apiospora marii]|uniref:uncharacterized protein n=1 Tax=Apiospora marii TaxID=335849 RepID=UPI0031320193